MDFRTKQEEKKLDFSKYNQDKNVQNANNADRNKKMMYGLGALTIGKAVVSAMKNIINSLAGDDIYPGR